ncbi:MAG: CoA transferase, partial [Actinobacteria bacterium]|nr:CoA transferase [Actinomycetota bacterium]
MDPAALDGVLVADFSRVLAGPYATMLLADLGATVVKVERPGSGDDTRAWGPPFAPDGQSTYFHSVNRNKRSIALDLTDPDDLAVALNLAQTCDVLVQNYKPGGLRRFGLDHASVAAVNPGVVYCSISGFGSGEGRDLPGYDLLVQAMGGLMSITGDDEPTKAGVAVVDVLTGLHATVAVLAALRHRDLTGSGQHVEVSLLSALLSSLVNQSSAYVGAGEVPQRLGNAHPSIAPYDLFATADRPMIVAVGNDAQFRRLAEVLQRPDLADNPDYRTNADRVAHRDNLKADLERVLRTHGADDWQRALTASGIPCGPINTIEQAFDQASRLGLDPVVDAGGMP